MITSLAITGRLFVVTQSLQEWRPFRQYGASSASAFLTGHSTTSRQASAHMAACNNGVFLTGRLTPRWLICSRFASCLLCVTSTDYIQSLPVCPGISSGQFSRGYMDGTTNGDCCQFMCIGLPLVHAQIKEEPLWLQASKLELLWEVEAGFDGLELLPLEDWSLPVSQAEHDSLDLCRQLYHLQSFYAINRPSCQVYAWWSQEFQAHWWRQC